MQNLKINFNSSFLFHPLCPIITKDYWFYVCNESEAQLLSTALVKAFSNSHYFSSFLTGLLLPVLPLHSLYHFHFFLFCFLQAYYVHVILLVKYLPCIYTFLLVYVKTFSRRIHKKPVTLVPSGRGTLQLEDKNKRDILLCTFLNL